MEKKELEGVSQMESYRFKQEEMLQDFRRFERKFTLSLNETGLALKLLPRFFPPAPKFKREQLNSLYFDYPEGEDLRKKTGGEFSEDRVRIRWYGEDADLEGMREIFVELKTRKGLQVIKKRAKLEVPSDFLAPHALWKGIIPYPLLSEILKQFGYFPPKPLKPVIKISFWRLRLQDPFNGKRVSLDFGMKSTLIHPPVWSTSEDLTYRFGILEIKGQNSEPPPLLSRIVLLEDECSRSSKYSLCLKMHMTKTQAPSSVIKQEKPLAQ